MISQKPAGQTSKPLLFIVDDEPMLLELATAVLQPQGFEIKTFRDPESTLAVYRQMEHYPALILTDYAMHTMTGMDLVRECRHLNPKQKIILLSGTVDENIYRNSPARPDRFLAKPYDTQKLTAVIHEVLGS